MATLKGPSFSGPRSGWTASSLAPQATAITTVAPTSPAPINYAERFPVREWDNDAQAKWAEDAMAWHAEFGANANTPEAQAAYPKPPKGVTYDDEVRLHYAANPNFGNPQVGSDGMTDLQRKWEPLNARMRSLNNLYTPEMRAANNSGWGPAVLGGGGGGGGGGGSRDSSGTGSSRGVTYTPTPLESLLQSMFPDAAASFDPIQSSDGRSSGPAPSLLNTILGNLGNTVGSGGGGAVYQPGFQSGQGAQIASTIPGAPSFLANSINNVQNASMYTPPAQGVNLGGLQGVAALSAEQRLQKAEMDQAKAHAEADWFKQQQKMQQQAAKRQQMQRQKMGSASGWSSNPTFY